METKATTFLFFTIFQGALVTSEQMSAIKTFYSLKSCFYKQIEVMYVVIHPIKSRFYSRLFAYMTNKKLTNGAKLPLALSVTLFCLWVGSFIK